MKEFGDAISASVYDPEQVIQCVSSCPSVKAAARQLSTMETLANLRLLNQVF